MACDVASKINSPWWALRATKKTDHLRATVTGKRSGESIQVESITLD